MSIVLHAGDGSTPQPWCKRDVSVLKQVCHHKTLTNPIHDLHLQEHCLRWLSCATVCAAMTLS